MPEHPARNPTLAIRNASKALLLAACVLTVAGCGGAPSDQTEDAANGEHFLSDQQKALERSKAAAAAMEKAAAERAGQTEDARSN